MYSRLIDLVKSVSEKLIHIEPFHRRMQLLERHQSARLPPTSPEELFNSRYPTDHEDRRLYNPPPVTDSLFTPGNKRTTPSLLTSISQLKTWFIKQTQNSPFLWLPVEELEQAPYRFLPHKSVKTRVSIAVCAVNSGCLSGQTCYFWTHLTDLLTLEFSRATCLRNMW